MSFFKHSILLNTVDECTGYVCTSTDAYKHCPATATGSSGIGYCCIPTSEYGNPPSSCAANGYCWKYLSSADCADLREAAATATTETNTEETAEECANFNACEDECDANFGQLQDTTQLEECKELILKKLKNHFQIETWKTPEQVADIKANNRTY